MIILNYIIFIVVSILLAGVSMFYRQNYVTEKKVSFRDSIQKNLMLTIAMCVVYILFAVLSLIYYVPKGFSMLDMVQNLLIWDAMFLISTIDFQVKKIPNKLLLVLLGIRVIGLVCTALMYPEDFLPILIHCLIGMALGGLIILIVLLISKGQVGAGDLKLYAIIGFFFGLTGLIQIMMYSLFLSALVAIVLLLSQKAKMKSTMAMAPFVLFGLTIFYVLY